MNDRNNNYAEFFLESAQTVLSQMAGLESGVSGPGLQSTNSLQSQGFAVIIGIVGSRKGRVVIDTTKETAVAISSKMNGDEPVDQELLICSMSELGNIIVGNAITKINNANKGENLSLSPPSVLFGDKLSIISPKILTEKIQLRTSLGSILISIGFERGV